MKTPKMIKVIYNGEFIKNIYPHATRFQVFKYRLAMFTRKTLIAGFIIGAIYGSFQLGKTTTPPVYVKAEDKSQAMFDSKIALLKADVANQLQSCEAPNYKESDALVTYDPRLNETVSSNIPSFGNFQFKKATVIYYYKTLYKKTITPYEAVLIALDESKAKELAIDVMFTTKNKAQKDWKTCAIRLNLDNKIDIINQLTK